MNLVGKIFVFLILFMSVVFMAFAVSVYSTHQNWKDSIERPQDQTGIGKPLGLKYQLAELKKQKEEENDKLNKLKEEKAALEMESKQVRAKLETERTELTAERDTLSKQRDDLMSKSQVDVATLQVQEQNLAKLTTEVEDLRKTIRDAQEDRDKQFARVVTLTDQAHQFEGELKRLQERVPVLATQVANLKQVLKLHNLSEFDSNIPPPLRGKVVAINKNDMVEVSLGSDDGLRTGATLEIFRGDKWLGRVEITTSTPDRAVGKIIPGFKNGTIQKGDDVATRLKLS